MHTHSWSVTEYYLKPRFSTSVLESSYGKESEALPKTGSCLVLLKKTSTPSEIIVNSLECKNLIKPWLCSLYQRWKSNLQDGLIKQSPRLLPTPSPGWITALLLWHIADPLPSLPSLALDLTGLWVPHSRRPWPGFLDFLQFFWCPNFLITCADTILISFNMSFFHSWEIYVCSGICPHLPLWKER